MNIIVTPELLEATANKFKSAQEQAQSQFTNLRQDISRLESLWYGSTKEKFYFDFQHSSQVMNKYIHSLQQIERQLKKVAEKFRKVDNETGAELSTNEGSLLDSLKKGFMTALSPTAKLGLMAGILNVIPNKKRNDLVDIVTRKWVHGKAGDVWNKLVPLKNFSTLEKTAASLGKLDKSLPKNSIKESNISKHIIKNMKPFGIASISLTALGEVNSLTSAIQGDFKKYDGSQAGVNIAMDTVYSTGKVVGNLASTYAGGVAGAEAGALAGSLIFPPVGTAVGAIAGGIIGSTVGGTAFNEFADKFVPRQKFKESISSFTDSFTNFIK
ncbi:WXG100 family type VII secretion target [Bacillus mycoides]|uniref:WXG100 family type VII secretion target n=2 Tax=Bacillus cereus group TaxID=86661 RepID=UPI002E244172|nr:WXG100 family type VII secretion target [Bacillus mycoides]